MKMEAADSPEELTSLFKSEGWKLLKDQDFQCLIWKTVGQENFLLLGSQLFVLVSPSSD